jgi:hypothetical protein
VKIWILIRIKVKIWILIRIKVMRIRISDDHCKQIFTVA